MYTSIAAYHFVAIDDPAAAVARVRGWAEAHALLGTVLVADEGINLFLAGSGAGIDAFLALLRGEARFAGLQAKVSHSLAQPFARLKVKHKPEIISFRRDGISPLDGRAPAVAPEDLARWIERGCDDDGRRLVLLDTRNREEVGHGTFAGALTLPIDNFTELPAALEPHREALADATVVGFCTGGIRCEKAVRWMRAEGFEHALQLDGGILGYFEAMGGAGYEGRCFVFDGRIALDPGLRAAADDDATSA
ncbi:sulfurtransferase [Luteimonas sp. A537]